MTSARAIEYRITQQLLRRREGHSDCSRTRVVERLISVTAAVAALAVLGSFAQELLWALGGAAAVLTLGIRSN